MQYTYTRTTLLSWCTALSIVLSYAIAAATQITSFVTMSTQAIDDKTITITLHLPVNKGDFLYRDYLNITTDSPHVALSSWQASSEAVSHYDETFKETKYGYGEPVSLTITARAKDTLASQSFITVTYLLNSKKKVAQEVIALPFTTTYKQSNNAQAVGKPTASPSHRNTTSESSMPNAQETMGDSWACRLSHVMEHSDSSVIRLAVAFLLGILLSLTPCIYPMIPITVGILQAHAGRSIVHNFALALAYSTGIATTFALLGLVAAFTGQLFGSLLANPVFVITIVILLAYLAFSMIGLYEMYTPRFLAQHGAHVRGGSFVAAFFFGAASGTVASPCLSPGLVLLLTIVTTLKSAFLGFAMLFSFGIGLSTPLLIIGTFSGSLSLLPRAGMWMVEVKRIFGFFMLAMCLYFLSNILPMHVIYFMASAMILIIGICYLWIAKRSFGAWNIVHTLLGMALIAGSVGAFFYAYRFQYNAQLPDELSIWQHDYETAVRQAKQEGTYVFVYVTAPYCSLCKAIERKIFAQENVQQAISKFVTVKVDGCDAAPTIAELQKRYSVVGAPTYLLINPQNGSLIKRWAGELYDRTATSVAQEFAQIQQS